MKRKELYEMVWPRAVLQVARELRVSDVGLAKVCRRLDIPLPPRGHWAKLQAGKSVEKVELPRPEWNEKVVLTIGDPKKHAERLAHEINDEMDSRYRALGRGRSGQFSVPEFAWSDVEGNRFVLESSLSRNESSGAAYR